LKRLWATWRMNYIEGEPTSTCFLCEAQRATRKGAEGLILERGDHSFLILNMFPYNSGHLMVAPRRHVSRLTGLKQVELHELADYLSLAERLLRDSYKPQGINIGMNMGKCAGAGLPGHLHWHVIPRWNGDTNFMPVVSDTKVVPESLERSFQRLGEALEKLRAGSRREARGRCRGAGRENRKG